MNGLFHRGAQNGLFVGLYLTLLSWVIVMAVDSTLMNLLALALLVLIPPGCYVMLRRTFVLEEGKSLISGLWLEGIISFICGSLIYALIAYAYLRFLNPEFIPDQVRQTIKIYEEMNDDQAREVVSLLKQIEKNNAYPTPQQIVMQLGLFITFIGSILSLLTASFLKIRGLRKK